MEVLVEAIKARGGVAHDASLQRAGFTRYQLRAAVAQGVLESPRRGWVAVPDADPYLIAAARVGVVLTCVTQAKRLGLWVLDEVAPHVGARSTASRLKLQNDKTRVHWSAPVQPRQPGELEDGLLNTLTTVAACQPFDAALAVWDSALNRRLTTKQELARLPLRPAARRLLEAVTPFADSGLETIFAARVGWLQLPIKAQSWIHGHRVDFLIADRLVVQIDGGHHVGTQRAEDVAHDAALMLLGYHVIRVTYVQVIERWPDVQDLIMRAIAQGLHLAA